MARRRKNAADVFQRLSGGETTLSKAALEALGLTRRECNRAVQDLIHSNMIEAGPTPQTYSPVDDKSICQLELEQRQTRVCVHLPKAGTTQGELDPDRPTRRRREAFVKEKR